MVAPLPKKRRDTSVSPEKRVVPVTLFAMTDVNDGVLDTETVGFWAVPPVVMLLPPPTLCTNVVAVERNTLERLVPPDVKVFAATDVNDGVDETATVGFCAVPPVTTFVPAPTDWT